MIYDEIQTIFQICSYLLNYPNAEFQASLAEVESIVSTLDDEKIKQELQGFIANTRELTLDELVHTYVYTFDLAKRPIFM